MGRADKLDNLSSLSRIEEIAGVNAAMPPQDLGLPRRDMHVVTRISEKASSLPSDQPCPASEKNLSHVPGCSLYLLLSFRSPVIGCIPNFPWRVAGIPQFFQVVLISQRIHWVPKSVMPIRRELAVLSEAA